MSKIIESTKNPYNQLYLESNEDLKYAVRDWELGNRDTIYYVSNGETVLAPRNMSRRTQCWKTFLSVSPTSQVF